MSQYHPLTNTIRNVLLQWKRDTEHRIRENHKVMIHVRLLQGNNDIQEKAKQLHDKAARDKQREYIGKN